MPTALWIILVVMLYILITGFWARFSERFWPFEYRGVSLGELSGHVNELYRRGYHGAELVIQAEGSGRAVRIRKEIPFSSSSIALKVIAASPTGIESDRHKLKRLLEKSSLEHESGLGGFARNPHGFFVPCGSRAEEAARAVETIFLQFYDLSETARYRLWVQGNITWQDRLIDSRNPHDSADWQMTLSGAYSLGRPYKRYHVPCKYSPLGLLGSLIKICTRALRRH